MSEERVAAFLSGLFSLCSGACGLTAQAVDGIAAYMLGAFAIIFLVLAAAWFLVWVKEAWPKVP